MPDLAKFFLILLYSRPLEVSIKARLSVANRGLRLSCVASEERRALWTHTLRIASGCSHDFTIFGFRSPIAVDPNKNACYTLLFGMQRLLTTVCWL